MFRRRVYSLLGTALALFLTLGNYPTPPALAAESAGDDPLPPGALARLGTPRLRQVGGAACAAFSPDGKTLASADATGIHIWEVATGKELHHLPDAAEVLAVSFSADGKSVFAAVKDCLVQHWDIETGKLLRATEQKFKIETYKDGLGKVKLVRGDGAAFTPDATHCLICREAEACWVFDAMTCKRTNHIVAPSALRIGSAALAPDGKVLVLIGSADGGTDGKSTITLYDAATGEKTRAFNGGDEGAGAWCAFSPDGRMLVIDGKKSLGLWDLAKGTSRSMPRQAHGPAVFSPDGKLLAFDDANSIRLCRQADLKEVQRFDEHRGPLTILAFSPDGKRLVSTEGHVIQLWEAATGKPMHTFSGHPGEVASLAFSPDGKTLASGGNEADSTLLLWDLATRRSGRPMSGHLHDVLCVAFSPDGKVIATGDGRRGTYPEDAFIRIWEPATGKMLHKFPAHRSGAYCLAFAPDGKQLASGGGDDKVCVWDLEAGKNHRKIRCSQDQINFLAFSPNGKALATAGTSNKLILWNSSSGEQRGQFAGETDCFTFVAFRRQGQTLITGERATFRRWDVESGKEVGRLSKNPDQVRCQALSPDGLTLATGGWDHNVYLWDMGRGRLVLSLKGHRGEVTALAFSSDGKRLASGSADTTVLLWDLDVLPRARLDLLLADLMSADKADGDFAAMTLETMPNAAVPALKERLVQAVAREKRIAALVIDLDDNNYEVRENASRELAKFGWPAEATLRALLDTEKSVEVQRRIQELIDLLSGIRSSPPPSESLAALRSVSILEHIGTPEAREILEIVAEGHPRAPLTKGAQAALARLAKH